MLDKTMLDIAEKYEKYKDRLERIDKLMEEVVEEINSIEAEDGCRAAALATAIEYLIANTKMLGHEALGAVLVAVLRRAVIATIEAEVRMMLLQRITGGEDDAQG